MPPGRAARWAVAARCAPPTYRCGRLCLHPWAQQCVSHCRLAHRRETPGEPAEEESRSCATLPKYAGNLERREIRPAPECHEAHSTLSAATVEEPPSYRLTRSSTRLQPIWLTWPE